MKYGSFLDQSTKIQPPLDLDAPSYSAIMFDTFLWQIIEKQNLYFWTQSIIFLCAIEINSVICCCKLNKTRNCDEHLLDNLVQGQEVPIIEMLHHVNKKAQTREYATVLR